MGVSARVQDGLSAHTLRGVLKSIALASLGRTIRCEVCGHDLFEGIPVIWRGSLKVLGSAGTSLRVDWGGKNTLVFRHVEQDICRAKASDHP